MASELVAWAPDVDDVPAALTEATSRELYGLEAGDVMGHALPSPASLPAGAQPGFALAGS